jgi:hypothetical protein
VCLSVYDHYWFWGVVAVVVLLITAFCFLLVLKSCCCEKKKNIAYMPLETNKPVSTPMADEQRKYVREKYGI